jgi:Gas vesicle synthesis protein GvpL/GvpF
VSAQGVYVYGVVEDGAELHDFEDRGLGPVRLLPCGEVAAICSDVEGDVFGRRRELKAHAEVLGDACIATTVVPFRFGTVLQDDEAVKERLLRPHAGHFRRELDRLRDVVQLNLRLTPLEDELVKTVVADVPALARLSQAVRELPAGAGQDKRLRLGEATAQAYRAACESIGQTVIQALAQDAREVQVEEIGGQDGTTKAALLVDRRQLTRLLDRAEQMAEHLHGKVRCRIVGPLPPFAFVEPVPESGEQPSGSEPAWV